MRGVAVVVVGCIVVTGCTASSPRGWTRSVVVTSQQHVRLALGTPTADACHARCLRESPASACLRTCDGALVEPGPCAVDDIACYAVFHATEQELGGRCGDPAPLRLGQTITACREQPQIETGPTTMSNVATTLVGVMIAVGVIVGTVATVAD